MKICTTKFGKEAKILNIHPDISGNIVVLHEDGRYRLHHKDTGNALHEGNISYDLINYKEEQYADDAHYGATAEDIRSIKKKQILEKLAERPMYAFEHKHTEDDIAIFNELMGEGKISIWQAPYAGKMYRLKEK